MAPVLIEDLQPKRLHLERVSLEGRGSQHRKAGGLMRAHPLCGALYVWLPRSMPWATGSAG